MNSVTSKVLSCILKNNSVKSVRADLVDVVVRVDLTHQMYLLMVICYYLLGYQSEEEAAPIAFKILNEYHVQLQEELESYVGYLDSAIEYTNEYFGSSEVDQFKADCRKLLS